MNRNRNILTTDQEKHLLSWVRQNRIFRDYLIILTIMRTGLRARELRELRVKDISANGEILIRLEVPSEIAADQKEREISLPDDLREQLKSFLNWKRQKDERTEPTTFLFTSQKSSQITLRHLQRIVRECTQGALGKPYRIHDLLRTRQHRKTETTFSDAVSPSDTIPPILVRLSFWIPSERIADFEAVYGNEIAPFLLQYGLIEYSDRGRRTVEGVFSRLFGVQTLAEVKEKAERLWDDPAWHEMLRSLAGTFGSADVDGRIPCHLDLYMVPSVPGTVVNAGQGRGCWHTFDGSNGLPDYWVYWILQDRDGNIWFATESGVSRYDGYRLTTLTTKDGLAHNMVFSMLQDSKGNLWFATGDGVSCYDGGNWITYTQNDGLAYNSVRTICEDTDGRLWFGTATYDLKGKGVSCYDGHDWATFTTDDGLANNNVFSIRLSSDGALWFGTYDGLSRYNGETWTTFTTADGLTHNYVYTICEDHEGNLWFGTWGGGVSRYDGQNWKTLTTQDGLTSNRVFHISQDAHGNLWFCCGPEGISCYAGHVFKTLTTEDGLTPNFMLFAFQDAEGVLWFAGGGGVNRYDNQTIATFAAQDGLVYDWRRVIEEDANGDLWFGIPDGGINWYDGRTFENFALQDRLVLDPCLLKMFMDSKGRLWSSVWEGYVQRYDGNTWTTFTQEDGLPGRPIFDTVEDKDGHIWFCTYEGVYRYDGETFTIPAIADDLAHNQVRCMLQDREGNLWFGTWGGGVSRYDGQNWKTFTSKDGLAEDRVHEGYGIFQDRDGNIWFGTRSGGVSRYDGERFTTFTTADGLSNNSVWSIFQDGAGYLWFGTSGGVCVFDGQVFQTFTQQDGLASNKIGPIFEDEKGSIWFQTPKGIIRYRRPEPEPPRISIDAVVADQRYVNVDMVTIPSNVGLVVFEFHGRSLRTRPEAMVYRYRLRDRHDWKITKEQRTEYLELPPGNYTFEVQAVDQHLVYSEPAAISVTVESDPQITALKAEIGYLRSAVNRKHGFENIIGKSDAIEWVRGMMTRAIESGMNVLVTGETGTGKELVANAIHLNSSRKDKPLIPLNCGAISRELVASELFGHKKGAFTGAIEDKMGLFEVTNGGTVILDEIGDMPLVVQANLLRVIEQRKVQRLGEYTLRDVDVRVIAMTNRPLLKEVKEGRFREDLYYRLNGFNIYIPPLRDRQEDIPLLAEHFCQQACHDQGRKLDGFAPGVLDMLVNYPWPGNVRELRNEVYRACSLAEDGSSIMIYHFSSQITQSESVMQDVLSEQLSYSESLNRFRRRLVEEALRHTGGNRTQAAKRLGMDVANLRRLIRQMGIEV